MVGDVVASAVELGDLAESRPSPLHKGPAFSPVLGFRAE